MEKKIKRLFSMFFMLFMAGCMVCLTSCKKDDDEDGDSNHDSRLIGTWEWKEARSNWIETETFTFNADGSGKYTYSYENGYSSGKDEATFTWQTKDNKTIYGTVTFKDESETYTEKYSFEYSISGNKLTVIGSISDTDTDDTQTYTKKK